MADKKISQLTASTTPLAGTEVLPVVQSGVTKQVSVANLTANRQVDVGSLTSTGNLVVDTNVLYVDTANNRVGVGTNAPANLLHLAGTAPYIRFQETDTSQTHTIGTGGGLFFVYDEIDGKLALQADGNQNIIVNTGNLVIGTAGKGIDFSADGQAAGMTSELLDDYEEGTFTPTVVGTTTAGTGTYNARTGVYTKVGDTVFFQLWINMSAHTGTGNFRITGLPFVSANIAGVVNSYSGAVGYCTGLAIPADGTVIWYVGQGVSQTDLYINSISTAVSSAALPLDPASQVQITGWYKAA